MVGTASFLSSACIIEWSLLSWGKYENFFIALSDKKGATLQCMCIWTATMEIKMQIHVWDTRIIIKNTLVSPGAYVKGSPSISNEGYKDSKQLFYRLNPPSAAALTSKGFHCHSKWVTLIRILSLCTWTTAMVPSLPLLNYIHLDTSQKNISFFIVLSKTPLSLHLPITAIKTTPINIPTPLSTGGIHRLVVTLQSFSL